MVETGARPPLSGAVRREPSRAVTELDGHARQLAPTSQFEANPAMAARSALFEAGLELAGVRLQLFTERLLQAAHASPDASCAELVRAALREFDNDALIIIADEPELWHRRLSHPAGTAYEAAEDVLRGLAVALLKAHRSPGAR